MTRTTWFVIELLWKVMVLLALILSLSARAEPPQKPGRLARTSPVAERATER